MDSIEPAKQDKGVNLQLLILQKTEGLLPEFLERSQYQPLLH